MTVRQIDERLIALAGGILALGGWIGDGILMPYFYYLEYIGIGLILLAGLKRLLLRSTPRPKRMGITVVSIIAVVLSLMMFLSSGLLNMMVRLHPYSVAEDALRNDPKVIEASGGIRHFSKSVGTESLLYHIGVVGKKESFYASVQLEFDRTDSVFVVKSIEIPI